MRYAIHTSLGTFYAANLRLAARIRRTLGGYVAAVTA
jgi:hypothetical protein